MVHSYGIIDTIPWLENTPASCKGCASLASSLVICHMNNILLVQHKIILHSFLVTILMPGQMLSVMYISESFFLSHYVPNRRAHM